MFLFFEAGLLGSFSLKFLFFYLLVKNLLSQSLGLLLGDLSGLLLGQEFGLLFRLLSQDFFPLFLFSQLQLLRQLCFRLGYCLGLLTFLLLDPLLLKLSLFPDGLFPLLLSECVLPGLFSLSLLLGFDLQSLQLLLFITLVSFCESNLLCLHLQFDLGLLVELGEFLSLVLYFL